MFHGFVLMFTVGGQKVTVLLWMKKGVGVGRTSRWGRDITIFTCDSCPITGALLKSRHRGVIMAHCLSNH